MSPREFWEELSEWSQATFGTDQERGPVGALKHLEKEVQEALEEGNSKWRKIEIVDCLFLVYDAARRSGMTFDELYGLVGEKLVVNKRRKWPEKQLGLGGDLPVEHIRVVGDREGEEGNNGTE